MRYAIGKVWKRRKSVEEAEMEADRLLHEAEEYRRLADRLARETGLARNYH